MAGERAAPLVILALDSGDPDCLLRWSRDGSMPHLGSLLERGWQAALTGPEMVSVHAVWPTVWSGSSMRVHGQYLRRPLATGSYDLRSRADALARTRPFWERIAAHRRRALILDAPGVPFVAGLEGVQIASWASHPSGPPVSEPAGIVDDLRRRFGRPIHTDEKQGTRWRDRRLLGELHARVEQVGRVCRSLYSEVRPDLVVACFAETHSSGHRFSEYAREDASGKGSGELRDAMRGVYRAIDGQIGSLLDVVGARANVFVVSNAGIARGYPSGRLMRSFCQDLGYQVPLAPRSAWARSLARKRRLAHDLWQDAIARLVPFHRLEGMRSLPATDWSRTTAFVIPSRYTGFLRVNLVGREPRGIVQSGREYDALLDRLEADLRELRDEDTGAAVVDDVVRVGDLFAEKPPRDLPDLIVEWRFARRPRRVVHPRAALRPGFYGIPRANHHSRKGLVIAAGRSVGEPGKREDLSPLDLAPMFLELLRGDEEARGAASS